MQRTWLTLLVFCIVFPSPTALKAETDQSTAPIDPREEAPSPSDYETVVVSPIPELADRVPRRTWRLDPQGPAGALVSSVTELAAEVGALAIQETNRGAGSPILRGLIGPQNAILLDDIPLGLSSFRTGPNQYFRLLPLSALASLGLYEGPSSVASGSGAMGGVVHARTLDPATQPTVRLQGGTNTADETLGGLLVATARHPNNPVVVGAQASRHGTLHSSGGYPWPASDFSEFNGFIKANLNVTQTQDITVFASHTGLQDAGRTDRLGQGDIRWYDNAMALAYLRWAYRPDRATIRSFRITPYVQYLEEGIERLTCSGDTSLPGEGREACVNREINSFSRMRLYSDTIRALGITADLTSRQFMNVLSLAVGAEFKHEQVTSKLEDYREDSMEIVRGQLSDGSQFATGALWVLGKVELYQSEKLGRLRLHVGERVTYSTASARDVPGVGNVDYSALGLVESLGLQWNHRSGVGAFVSFDQGFRVPNLQETTVLGDTGSKFEVPNPDLGAERSEALESGVSYRNGDWRLMLSGHATWLRDLIDEQETTYEGQSEIDGKPVVIRVNANGGFYWGGSIETSWEAGAWSTSLRGSYTFGEIERDDGVVPGRRVPPVLGNLTLAYAFSDELWLDTRLHGAGAQERLHPSDEKDLRICETAQFSGERQEDCNGSPAWVSLDIRTGWQMTKGITLVVKLQNVLDSQYRIHGSGLDQPGRSLWAALRYEMPD